MGMSSCIHTLQGEDGDGGNIVLVITLSAFFPVFIHFVITDVLHSACKRQLKLEAGLSDLKALINSSALVVMIVLVYYEALKVQRRPNYCSCL